MKNILFESYPDFSGSPLQIYNKLHELGYHTKYNLVWAVDSTFNVPTSFNVVKYFGMPIQIQHEIINNTQLIIDSNRYIFKYGNAKRLHTRHGSSLKHVDNYSKWVGDVDMMLSTSYDMVNVDRQIYPDAIKDKFIVTGYPNNDVLLSSYNTNKINNFIRDITHGKTYSKVIGWFPTYRQHRHSPTSGSPVKFTYGLPIINSADDYSKLSNILAQSNTLLVVQYHHAQAHNYTSLPPSKNVIVVDNSLLDKHHITMFDLLHGLDALITDYSAIYYEYMLLNRPIALAIPDLVQYDQAFGFCFNYLEFIKGVYCIKVDQLCAFVCDVANSKDTALMARKTVMPKIHTYCDNHSTTRVVDYLIQHNYI